MDAHFPTPESIAHAFVRAINRQDLATMAELMAPDHCFIDSLGQPCTGRERMVANWKQYFVLVPDYTLAIEEILTDGPVVVLLALAQGTYTADGRLLPENRWQTPLAARALVQEGLIAEWRIFADNEPIRQRVRAAESASARA